jgi:hypothetical protein
MANPHRGEVALTADDKSYTLCFSINEMCAIEALLKRTIVEIALELEMMQRSPVTMNMTTIRAVMWAALRRHQRGISEEEAGDILAIVGFAEVMKLVLAAIHAAFPRAEAGDDGRPPVAEG